MAAALLGDGHATWHLATSAEAVDRGLTMRFSDWYCSTGPSIDWVEGNEPTDQELASAPRTSTTVHTHLLGTAFGDPASQRFLGAAIKLL